ncbi:MAG: F0F1 ATP synthase subunit epsilon [Deltaproteobacteria bacterium]|nr:F0F1 ATP synthase subunit epsilon [Deltaproteobacteria bacterium]
MDGKLDLEIVTPSGPLISESVDEVVVPGALGEMGILPGHLPIASSLKPGEIVYKSRKNKKSLAVSWGFVEVSREGKVNLLADTAETADAIDVERAKRAKEKAEKELAKISDTSTQEYKKNELKLQRALVRIQVARKSGKSDT